MTYEDVAGDGRNNAGVHQLQQVGDAVEAPALANTDDDDQASWQ